MPMNLSNIKYCDAIKCPKKVWFDNNFPQLADKSLKISSNIINNLCLSEIGIAYFGSCRTISDQSDLPERLQLTKEYLASGNSTIAEATFLYDDCLCTIDLLHQEDNHVTIYAVKETTMSQENNLEELKYQAYILHQLGYNISNICLLYINQDYTLTSNLCLNKLFKVEDYTYLILSSLNEVKNNLSYFKTYFKQTKEPLADLDIKCLTPSKCPYFQSCHSFLQKNNVFDLCRLSASSKIELYQQGLYTYEVLLKTNLNITFKLPIYYELYDAAPYINKEHLTNFLNELSSPLFFLDITSLQTIVPLYKDTKPYQRLPFQYSLASLNEELNDFTYTDYLSKSTAEPQRLLAESLVKNIPLNSCLLTYNSSLKKEILQELANLYPDLSAALLNISAHLQDLMTPFYNYDYYCQAMHGSYLFKDILSALFPNEPKLAYQKVLSIHDDTEAALNYLKMAKLPSKERSKLHQSLKKYVHFNTYAMTRIFTFLQSLIK